eukprot:TRINITY_DN1318_c5_g1_i1.p2 TRINITY_DN1318_c5_g1~~TRINITY_DN1318_c5_g1_i1.p2  ORF type:complete len:132 (-),score=1.61 TRINITY_DN1318_c5_g1_i1:422-817(-)
MFAQLVIIFALQETKPLCSKINPNMNIKCNYGENSSTLIQTVINKQININQYSISRSPPLCQCHSLNTPMRPPLQKQNSSRNSNYTPSIDCNYNSSRPQSITRPTPLSLSPQFRLFVLAVQDILVRRGKRV